jgi:hypothetical protein
LLTLIFGFFDRCERPLFLQAQKFIAIQKNVHLKGAAEGIILKLAVKSAIRKDRLTQWSLLPYISPRDIAWSFQASKMTDKRSRGCWV